MATVYRCDGCKGIKDKQLPRRYKISYRGTIESLSTEFTSGAQGEKTITVEMCEPCGQLFDDFVNINKTVTEARTIKSKVSTAVIKKRKAA